MTSSSDTMSMYARPGPTPTRPSRLVILGASGVGKSTLAERVARLRDCPHVELDALHWEPNWTPADPAAFRARITAATADDAWVVSGNYLAATRDTLWPRADTLVWLDYSLPRAFWQTLRRTARRR